MSIIKNLIIGNPYDLAKGLEPLEDRAFDACLNEAEQMNLDTLSALSNLDEFDTHLPDPAEVARHLAKNQQGNWEATLRLTATLATRAALEAEVETDIAKIKKALHEAEMSGFRATKLYATNAYGWAPHFTEIDWKTGTLIEWRFRDGEFDAALLEVELADFAEIWIDLTPMD
jgi:hypothetical protein